MHYPADLLPSTVLIASHLLFWPLLCYVLFRTQWWRLKNSSDMHAWLATSCLVLLLWQMRGGIEPGLEFHIQGTTLLTLMFGRYFAVLSIGMAGIASVLSGAGSWQTLPLTILVLGMLPAVMSWSIWKIVERRLPKNLFIYIFVTAFFGSALCTVVPGIINASLAAASGIYDWDYLGSYYLPYALMLAVPEAFITGTMITMLTVFKPEWVLTFRDSHYLHDK